MNKIHNNYLQRFFAILLIGIVFWSLPLPAYAEGGECGENLSWVFSAGTLIISGKGDMDKYSDDSPAPWHEFRDEITRISFADGITSIGTLAFRGCVNLKSVVLPDSVRSIGAYAFSECENLVLLDMGKGVTSIGNGAFHSCLKLDALTIPYGVSRIGYQAFYRCESLVSVIIPPNVTNWGSSSFSYCTSLVSVTVNARIDTIPEWTFYGCEMLESVVLAETVKEVEEYAFKNCDTLSTVYYNGNAKEDIDRGISEDNENFGSFGHISNSEPPKTVTSTKVQENDDGSVVQQQTTVRTDENSTVITKTEQTFGTESKESTLKTEISVTVDNKDGWDTATEAVKDALKDINQLQSTHKTDEKISVTINVKNEEDVSKEFVSDLAGRDINVTIVTSNGSSWKNDYSGLDKDKLSGEYTFSYTVIPSDKDICEKIGTDSCYTLSFLRTAVINTEVLIQLPAAVTVNGNAFLYQQESDGSFTRLQAVAVDNKGVAHFFLASVDKDTVYVIGINVPGEKTDDVIIPDELATTNNAIQRLEVIEYVTTGVRNYKGLTLKHLTLIIIGAVVAASIVVGVIMYMLNKRNINKMRQSNT